ncbi:type II secretion system F family protein, partial [Pseudomonas aeruginosa]
SDPVTWTGPLATLNAIASFVTGPGIYVLVAVITLTVVVIVTLPTYRWKGRVWLDRTLPPWSIYRMLQGTTFLLNMAVMLNAGIRPYDSLASMIKISPPWLKQRLEAARYGVGLGQNLGVALRSAG